MVYCAAPKTVRKVDFSKVVPRFHCMQLRTKPVTPKLAIDRHANTALPGLGFVDFVEFGRDTMGATMTATASLSAGAEAIGQEVAQHVRAAFEHAGATTRGLLTARTLEDVVRLQTHFAEQSLASFFACGTKLAELGRAIVGASVGGWDAHAKR